MTIVPGSIPKQTREATLKMLVAANIDLSKVKVALVGVRGYYKTTMGKPDINDRGMYDDAIFVISEHTFAAFNANVDPSAWRTGIACLKPGVWWYKQGIHGLSKPVAQQYRAFVQAAEVTVRRDNQGDDTGYFGINIHRGSYSSTSSLGCQTIYPSQWEAFRALAFGEMDRARVKKTPYILVIA